MFRIQSFNSMNHFLTSVVYTGLIIIGSHFSSSQTWAAGMPNARNASSIITVTSGGAGGAVLLGGTVVPEKIVNLTAQMPGDVNFVAGSEGDAFRRGQEELACQARAGCVSTVQC